MPEVPDIQTTEDAILSAECSSFAGGMQSAGPRNRLQPTQAYDLLNVIFARDGRPETRPGAEALGTPGSYPVQGLCYFDIPTTEMLVRVVNGAVAGYREERAEWENLGGPGFDATANVCMEQGNGRLYFANGVNDIRAWNGSTWSALTGARRGSQILYSSGRLIVMGIPDHPDAVDFSNLLDEGAFPVTGRIRLGENEGDEIVTARRWVNNTIAFFKRANLWLVDADPLLNVSQFSRRQLPGIGCVAARTVQNVGNDILFLSHDGVRSLRRVLTDAEAEVSLPISDPIQPIINTINWEAIECACAASFANLYILFVPTGTSEVADTGIVYNVETKSWLGRWTGWTPTVFATSYFGGGKKRLQWGETDGRVLRWLNYIDPKNSVRLHFKDAGTDIETVIETRALDFDLPDNKKSGVDLRLEFHESQATGVEVKLIRDEKVDSDAFTTVDTPEITFTLPATLPWTISKPGINRTRDTLLHEAPFQELAVRITSTAGKLSLRRIKLTAQAETLAD